MASQIKPFAVSTTDVSHVVIELFGGDNNLSDFVDLDLDEMAAGIQGPFAVIGLADFAGAGGQIVEITRTKGRRVIQEVGEIDTGDPETLATFLARALVTYDKVPHRALGFWDHGTGVFQEDDPDQVVLTAGLQRGAPRAGRRSSAARRLFIPRHMAAQAEVRAMLHDDTSGGVLTNVEAAGVLRAGFQRAGQKRKLDMIFSDTCLNGMVEVLDQLEPFATVVVGSEELEPGDGWDYQRLYRAMSGRPPSSAVAWARLAVDAYRDAYANRPEEFPCTLAAYRSKNTIPARFADLVKAVEPLGERGFRDFSFIRQKSQGFAQRDTYDLKDFAARVGREMPETAAASAALISALDKAAIRNAALGPHVRDANGLAFWFPTDTGAYGDTQATYRQLDFDLSTHWTDYLSKFLGSDEDDATVRAAPAPIREQPTDNGPGGVATGRPKGGRSLTGDGALDVDGIRISAPGLAGDVVVEPGSGRGPRRRDRDVAAFGPAGTAAFGQAMARQAMQTQTTIRIDGPTDVGSTTRGLRRDGTSPPRPETIRVAVPKPPKRQAQVILSRDEHGITTWHFPEKQTRGDTFTPAGSDLFVIERVPSGPVRRGLGLSKILEVVTFPVAAVAGKVAEFEVRKWDHEHHPTLLRAYGPDKSLRELKAADWARLEAGPCLVFIHGTFDTITGCFSRLPDATLEELHRRYEGRVIALDHPTLADSPIENAREFFKAIGDHRLEVDLVCHSRGGLVARSIVERPEDLAPLGPNVTIGEAVLVGATTNGTDLADVDRWNQLIDRLSTLLSFAPLPAAVDILESVFGLIRSIAVNTAHDLDGLDAMSPKRPFLHKLNDTVRIPAGTTYRVIDSNYEPDDPDLKAFFVDGLKDDVVFHGPNDGMVAIDSIEGRTLTAPFPVLEPCFFGPADGVEHANYFGQAKTSRALLGWLTGGGPGGGGAAAATPTRSAPTRAAARSTRSAPASAPRRGNGGGAAGGGGGDGGGAGSGGSGGSGRGGGSDGPSPGGDEGPGGTIIDRATIEGLIFNSAALRRYTQDSPILPDVWFEFGAKPNQRIDLLLTPKRSEPGKNPPGEIVKKLRERLDAAAQLAYSQSTVVARLDFAELVAYLLPLCTWRVEATSIVERWLKLPDLDDFARTDLARHLVEFETGDTRTFDPRELPLTVLWGLRLIGRFQLAREGAPIADVQETLASDPDRYERARRIVDAAIRLIVPGVTHDPLIFTVSLNRHADVSVNRSVPTVKADAARGLFPVDLKSLAWAVIDSGIDATHPAFRGRKAPTSGKPIGDLQDDPFRPNDGGREWVNNTRILATYDFTGVRDLTDPRRLEQPDLMDNAEMQARVLANPDLASEMLETLKEGRQVRWTRFAELLKVPHEGDGSYHAPDNEHGTHVAGILAGDWRRDDVEVNDIPRPEIDVIGVCPTLQLYDLRVFGSDGTGTEYAVLAAIEFLQALTNEREELTVQGVNMSFSIRHDVANYACGRTPVCDAVTKLVNSGVVVVAAAGNDGYWRPRAGSTEGGEGYRTVSITDPGNTEAAITVGSTHSYRPYAYGVSYFSSRGPTGDGRAKPDLVAPGEKISSAVPDGRVLALDGTSMATPHVSGCAALLMARYRELIGDPDRIKSILTATASDLGRESYFQGHGLVDVLRAMQSI